MINCVDNVGVNVVVGIFVLNVFVPVNALFPLKLDLLFICVCISDVIFVKNANLEFGTLFIFPDTIKLFPYVVVNVELL